MSPEDRKICEEVDALLEGFDTFEGNLLMILHELQEQYRYLPEVALARVSEQTGFSLQRLYAVATFYHHFSLTPKGRHEIHVCLGTACHVRGAPRVMSELEQRLGVRAGGTTADGEFSLSAVRCIGACSLAPVVLVDKETHANVLPQKVERILKKVRCAGTSSRLEAGTSGVREEC